MAIDGRDIARRKQEKDAYESPTVRIVAIAIVVVPSLLVLALLYWVGALTGGVTGGVLSVVGTILTAAVLWLFQRRRRR